MKVSIVIPVYNSAATLRDCLASILNQTFQDWEAICVNDGSKDNSLAILEEYANKDCRIKVITQSNCGAASARNTALEHIPNENNRWISFVDSDDYICPWMYEYIEQIITKEDNEKIDYIRIFPTRTSMRYIENKPFFDRAYLSEYIIVDKPKYFHAGTVGGLTASIFIKASIVKDHKLKFPENMRILEDQVFSLSCASRSRLFILLHMPVYYYYSNPNSLISKSTNKANDIIQCLNYTWDILKKNGDEVTSQYFDNEYKPAKAESLLIEILKWRRKPQNVLNQEIFMGMHPKGIKAKLIFFLTKILTH